MDEKAQVVDREDLMMRIRIANALSLFDDARQNIQLFIDNYGKVLTKEEVVFFAVFYRNSVNKFRKEYDLYMYLQRELPRKEVLKHRILRDNIYRARYEVVTICKEVIDMIDHGMLDTKNIEFEIFFLKLRADFYRYWSGVVSEDQFFEIRRNAENCYQTGLELADKKLKKYHPLRLRVMLNMSILYYAVPCERIKALQLLMQAVTEGKEHAKNNSDVRATVNLLQDNLNDWMADVGPNERHELEILEGARKWHGKGAAKPSVHLRRYLSGQRSPKRTSPTPCKRYFTFPQPLVQHKESDETYVCNYFPLKQNPSILNEPLALPETTWIQRIPRALHTGPTRRVSEPGRTELQSTQTTSQIIASVPTTLSTPLTTTRLPTTIATAELQSTTVATTELQSTTAATTGLHSTTVAARELQSTTVTQDSSCTELSGNKHLCTSLPQDQHESHKDHSEQPPQPDFFEEIFQPIISFSPMPSSPTTSSQSADENDNGDLDQTRGYRSSIIRTSSPRDIPHTSGLTPTTIDPISWLTVKLRNFESRMLSANTNEMKHEHPAGEQELEVEHPSEGNPLPETHGTTSRSVSEEPQAPSNIIQELQLQLQNISIDRTKCYRDTELQRQSTNFLSQHVPEIGRSVEHPQHRNISEIESAKPSRTYEHIAFPKPAPPIPPTQNIFTPIGPKLIGNFPPNSFLEGAVAVVSPSSPVEEKKSKAVTFRKSSIYSPIQSTEQVEFWNVRIPRQRTARQRSSGQRRSTPPPSLRTTTPEQEGQLSRLAQNRSAQEMTVITQQDPSPQHFLFNPFYPQQIHRPGPTSKVHRRKLAQRKLLRRSFSAPRVRATWPLSSLVREPPYFIYRVQRRASSTREQTFGRLFLSAHSSAEDLYDEAAEKVFPDPWAPRETRTMRNTFPITPWHPNEKVRVPWIRYH